MKVAFVTTQSLRGSTIIGRVMPLARQLAKEHQVHVLVLGQGQHTDPNIQLHSVGCEPFTRTQQGKTRLTGLPLATRLLAIALKTTAALFRINPDVVIIVKSLPHNVLGTYLWSLFNKRKKIILDVDDFELTANVLTTLNQRAAIHWAERTAAKIAYTIITASPFLKDHFEQLTQNNKKVVMIPTGLEGSEGELRVARRKGIQPDVIPRGPAPSLSRGGGSGTGGGLERSRRDRTRSDNHCNLLYLGSLSISSGHRIDLLPDILALVQKTFPHIQLHIAGDGDDTAKLKRQFTKQGLKHVHWHGRFTFNEVERLLKQAPILLDPIDASIANRAKSSFRTILAAASGLPIVTSDIGIRPYLLPQHLHDYFFASPR